MTARGSLIVGGSVMVGQGGGPPVVGVDLGGTKILVGVVDAENRILGRAKRPTPAKEGGTEIVRTIVDCIDAALDEGGAARSAIAGIGIGSAGPPGPHGAGTPLRSTLSTPDLCVG